MNRIETVIESLKHHKCSRLPKGELFIDRDFLSAYFQNEICSGIEQLDIVCQSLDLDVIGISMYESSFIGSLLRNEYKKLKRLFMVGCLEGPFEFIKRLKGFDEAILDIKFHQSTYAMVTSRLVKYLSDVIELAQENGFMAIAILDDIAGKQGLMMSCRDFENLIYPFYEKATKLIKQHGLYAFFHSDGNIYSILKYIEDAGFDCLHCVDAQAGMDLYELRAACGANMTFMGHLDLLAWNDDKIKRETQRAENEFVGGGLILGSSCGISKWVTIDKINQLYPTWHSVQHS